MQVGSRTKYMCQQYEYHWENQKSLFLASAKPAILSNHIIPTFNDPKEEGFRKLRGKRRNAGNQIFFLFPQCFLLYQKKNLSFLATFYLSSANSFNLVMSKSLSFGKGLIPKQINDTDYDL